MMEKKSNKKRVTHDSQETYPANRLCKTLSKKQDLKYIYVISMHKTVYLQDHDSIFLLHAWSTPLLHFLLFSNSKLQYLTFSLYRFSDRLM